MIEERKISWLVGCGLFAVAFMFGLFVDRRTERAELEDLQRQHSDLEIRNEVLQRQIAAVDKHTEGMFDTHSNFFNHFEGRIQILEASQPDFVDESEVPAVEGGASVLAMKYPRIIIDGEKLYYNADLKTYCYHGTMQRAMWLGAGPERMLMTPTKEFNGVMHEFVRGKWQPGDGRGNKQSSQGAGK